VPTKSTPCRVRSDLDIYRAANLLIQRHGRDAAVEAGRLVGLMLGRGDMEGRQVWLRVRRDCAVASGADRSHPVTTTVAPRVFTKDVQRFRQPHPL
jgi:hypothetical protein